MPSRSLSRRRAVVEQSLFTRFLIQARKRVQSVKNQVLACISSQYLPDEILENGFSSCVMSRGRKDLAFLQNMDRTAERDMIEVVESNSADNLSVCSFEEQDFHEAIIPRRISLPALNHLKPGDFFLAKYEVILMIENGKFGDVFRVENMKSSKQFILKTYSHFTENSCKVFQFVNDNNNPHLEGSLWNYDINFRGYSIFSFHRETIHNILHKNSNIGFPEKHVWQISRQILSAISYLHNHDIIHTSIDPYHIFFADPASQQKFEYLDKPYYIFRNPYIKLEMSVSAISGDEPRRKLVSNQYYRAPEVMCDRYWSKPIDIWAAGLVIFEIYAGVRLGCNDKHTLFRVINRCVGIPNAKTILWLEHCDLEEFLSGPLSEGVVAHEMNYDLQKAIMYFDALDISKPFGNFLLQMIHLDPRERLPIHLLLKHPYQQRQTIHIFKHFFAS